MRRRASSSSEPPEYLVIFDVSSPRWGGPGVNPDAREAAWLAAREEFKRAHGLDWLDGDDVPPEPWDEAWR